MSNRNVSAAVGPEGCCGSALTVRPWLRLAALQPAVDLPQTGVQNIRPSRRRPSAPCHPCTAASSAAAQHSTHDLSPADLELFHTQGWLLTPPLLTPAGLETLRRETMAAWGTEKGETDQAADGLTWLQVALVPNVHRISVGTPTFNVPIDRSLPGKFLSDCWCSF